MSSTLFARLRRDIAGAAAFRLTLRFAGLFVLCLLTFDLVAGLAARWAVERSIRAEVAEILDEAAEAYAEDGADGLAAAIAEFAAEDEDILLGHYGAAGQLAGTLTLAAPAAGWSVLAPEGVDEDEALWVKTAALPDGSWISAAASSEVYHDVAELTLAAAAWAVAIALPLALLCGALLGRAVLGRLAPIAETAAGVREGALSRRAPVGADGDEFDRLAADINAMLESIESLTRNLRNVSVGIAHELRTPLARIRNRLVELQALHRVAGTDDAIETVLVDMDQALETFDALLKIGQIEADAERKGFETVALSDLVADLAEIFEPVAAEQGKRLSARIEPGVELRGNRALLAQLVSNLLENAIEHTPAGTSILLELGRNGASHVLAVEDDGPGVPPAERERIFDRFYRLERSRAHPGNGLGLSLVRSICSLHGLAIRLIPHATGARFEVAI